MSPGHDKILRLIESLESDRESLVADFENLNLKLYREGRYRETIEICEETLNLDPLSATTYNNKCCALNQLGRWTQAIDACNKALKIEPEQSPARGNLAWARKGLAAAGGRNR